MVGILHIGPLKMPTYSCSLVKYPSSSVVKIKHSHILNLFVFRVNALNVQDDTEINWNTPVDQAWNWTATPGESPEK